MALTKKQAVLPKTPGMLRIKNLHVKRSMHGKHKTLNTWFTGMLKIGKSMLRMSKLGGLDILIMLNATRNIISLLGAVC